jgi:hypothetical protein
VNAAETQGKLQIQANESTEVENFKNYFMCLKKALLQPFIA